MKALQSCSYNLDVNASQFLLLEATRFFPSFYFDLIELTVGG